MQIDAHVHLWRLDRGDYGWLTPDLAPIHRDFGPEHLVPLLHAEGVDGVVLVQAAPTLAETEYLLSLAADHDFVKGVVGWVDFEAPHAPDDLARLAGHAKFKGVRPMIHDIADDDWMVRPALAPAFRAVAELGLRFDALIRPRHLSRLMRLVDRYPDLPVMVDHAAKPDIAGGGFEVWARAIAAIAAARRAMCKVSGLVTEAGPDWSVDRIRPYTEHLIDCFGTERLVFGSDWPVVTLRTGYADWMDAVRTLFADLSGADRNRVFGANAVAFYGL